MNDNSLDVVTSTASATHDLDYVYVGEWLTIDTAPKSEGWVLVTDGEVVFKAMWSGDVGAWISADVEASTDGAEVEGECWCFTDEELWLWMPLPYPPRERPSAFRRQVADAVSKLSDHDLSKFAAVLGLSAP